MPLEPESDGLGVHTALQGILNLSLHPKDHPQSTREAASHRIDLDPQCVATLRTAADVDPNRLQAQPPKILLHIIERFLKPQDAIALALTSHLFMEIVPWALQTPFNLICSPDPTDPPPSWLCRLSRTKDYFASRSPTAQAHKDLFRTNLRDSFGPTHIYCGLPGKPAMRDVLPLRDFKKTAADHLCCCCMSSLILREIQLKSCISESWEMRDAKRHISR